MICIFRGILHKEVFLGATQRNNPNEPGQIRLRVESDVIHEDYNAQNFNNDVALLQIQTAPLSAVIQVVGLADDLSETFYGQSATVSGWGRKTDEGDASYILNHVSVQVITNIQCALVFGAIITDSTLCTQAAICNGDSGSPLVIDNVQIGVSSFSAATSCSNYPSAYARVSHFRQWIYTATGGVV